MRRRAILLICLALPVVAAAGCHRSSSSKKAKSLPDPVEPAFAAVQFVSRDGNSYLPLVPGTSTVYEGQTSEGFERVEVFVSHLTREVFGVTCAVVVDRAYVDGELVEETFDWYAKDADGNVWYMGEDARQIEGGLVVGTEGSWEAGVDGAEGGIVMKTVFQVGDTYRQELYPGEAEDMAEIVGVGVQRTLGNGMTYTCLKTREWNPLDPGSDPEFKYFAPGVGLVREELTDGSDGLDLVEVEADTEPAVDPADFPPVPLVNRPLFPLLPGRVLTYEGDTDEGTETVTEEVLSTTRTVMGIECAVVYVLGYVDGELIEETWDWYAQDLDGNVWYMGEDSRQIEGGVIVSTDGSWEAGVDGAMPGIIMKAEPRPGDSYRQEYYAGEAEDMAEVVALEVPVTLSDGTSYSCLKTRDWTPLEPGADEYKYYAPGIGLVLETLLDDSQPIELTDITQK